MHVHMHVHMYVHMHVPWPRLPIPGPSIIDWPNGQITLKMCWPFTKKWPSPSKYFGVIKKGGTTWGLAEQAHKIK